MDLYAKVSRELAEVLTKRYSTSFSLSSRLFDKSIRSDIYSIYGLVRLADEIVDSYRGEDATELLDELYGQVERSLKTNYSTNPIVYAFVLCANKYQINHRLIKPFFDSMKMDISPEKMTKSSYKKYIYGSAEVVGLMCLKVFTGGDAKQYDALSAGARSLGAAYQKVNFLRDMSMDYETLGRVYFPGLDYQKFSQEDKDAIVADIETDFLLAKAAIQDLPENSRKAVLASYYYYSSLLKKLKNSSPKDIKSRRYRIINAKKIALLVRVYIGL